MTTPRPILRCGARRLPLGERTFVMGIVNVTPDSFSDGGRFRGAADAVAHGLRLIDEGADVLDIGGESTRPGAAPVTPAEEQARVLPVVEGLAAAGIDCISVDTRNAATAEAAHRAGARWLNEVSALTHDPRMVEVAGRFDVVVLMHARGEPETMQAGAIEYADVVDEVGAYLATRVRACGLPPGRVLVDPGIGFGKRLEHNLALTQGLAALRGEAAGVLYGPSRKRFLGELTQVSEAAARDPATHAALALGIAAGADWVRVHDVAGAQQVARVVDAVRRVNPG